MNRPDVVFLVCRGGNVQLCLDEREAEESIRSCPGAFVVPVQPDWSWTDRKEVERILMNENAEANPAC